MSTILTPYHLDQHLPGLRASLPPDADLATVTEHLPEGDIWARLAPLYESVARAVEESARAGVAPTVVSGDCTVSLAVMAGLQRGGVAAGVVWFDAHGDVQTLETTTSGYVGGMPLRILVGYRPELISDRLGLRPIPEERAVLVDARDLDPPEVDYLAASSLRRRRVDEVAGDELGGPLLLHIDLDVFDPADLPGLRFPAPGGAGVPAVLAAVRRVLGTGRVVALDLACTWDPDQPDPTGARAELLSHLIDAMS